MVRAFQRFSRDQIVRDGLPTTTHNFVTYANELVAAGYLNSNNYSHFAPTNPAYRWMATGFYDEKMTKVLISGDVQLPSGRHVLCDEMITIASKQR